MAESVRRARWRDCPALNEAPEPPGGGLCHGGGGATENRAHAGAYFRAVSNRQEMVWGGLLRTPGAPAPSRYLVGYVFTGAVLMWKQLNGSVQRYWAAQHSCVPSPDLCSPKFTAK